MYLYSSRSTVQLIDPWTNLWSILVVLCKQVFLKNLSTQQEYEDRYLELRYWATGSCYSLILENCTIHSTHALMWLTYLSWLGHGGARIRTRSYQVQVVLFSYSGCDNLRLRWRIAGLKPTTVPLCRFHTASCRSKKLGLWRHVAVHAITKIPSQTTVSYLCFFALHPFLVVCASPQSGERVSQVSISGVAVYTQSSIASRSTVEIASSHCGFQKVLSLSSTCIK